MIKFLNRLAGIILCTVLVIVFLLYIGGLVNPNLVPVFSGSGIALLGNNFNMKDISSSFASADEWNLIVVNEWNQVPDDYTIDITELSNGEKVDSRIYPDLQDMFDEARAEGVYPIVRAGYRTNEEQMDLLERKIEAYQSEGYSKDEAEEMAEKAVAKPGTSEHELGIAVDINADKNKSSSDEVYTWLADHAYEYGFILRYPADKEDITGIEYEPWHYRYVGQEAAKEIYEQRICLEEYVEK